jgi:Domain of unknown function (DUF4114)/Vanadium chloroperoxidase N-terminal domain
LVQSKGNTVVEWNDITVDAARMAGVPPAASTRYFAMVHAAIYDAVQGITQTAGRQSYLQSQGINIAPPPAGANADVAAAAAGRAILNSLFTDPNNPVANNAFNPPGGTPTTVRAYYPGVLTAALDGKVDEVRGGGASQASIDAGIAYGNAVARAVLALRQTDGYLLDETGLQRNIPALSSQYIDGIENPGRDEAGGENDGTVGRLSNGTNLIGTGAAIRTNGTNPINSTAATTPGAWRRAEDTLNTAGQFAGLASPEVASINQTWFLPTVNFFNDSQNPPPALDSQQYVQNVAEVRAEGGLLDLPVYGTNTTVTPVSRSLTVNGVTSPVTASISAALGTAINDTNTAEFSFPGVNGADAPSNLPTTTPDGIGTTSEERTVIAHVWANAEGSYGPNYAYQKIAQQLAINNNDSLADSAYRFALLDFAFADGFANLWDSKWDEDYFWRPVSAVRNADQITATASLDDNNWTPRENTPQHPCHPSGTSASAGLASTILASFYGENPVGGFTVSADVNQNSARLARALTSLNGNDNVGGVRLEEVSRNYTSFTQARNETRLSRIYAGAHFRFATERGTQLGNNIGNYLLNNNPLLAPSTQAPATGVFRSNSFADAESQARWLGSGARIYEFGSITVDDASGRIDGLSSSSADYLAAALRRRNVIFDGRSNADGSAVSLNNQAASEGRSAGQLAGANLSGNTIFYVTENGVTTLSNTGGDRFAASSASGLNRLTFRDSANQDVVFEVGAALPAFRTTGNPGSGNTSVAVSISRAATFNSSVGIYAVDDNEGCFDTNNDGLVDLRVGQAGYLAEALRRAALNTVAQATTNGTTANSSVSLAAGQSFGLLLVADGTVAQASASGSTLNVFSSYAGANSDGVNHVVRLGNGTTEVFGFEDQLGGGDRDFNDLIVSVTRATA